MSCHFYLPHVLLLSELACDAVPSRVALSSKLHATVIDRDQKIILSIFKDALQNILDKRVVRVEKIVLLYTYLLRLKLKLSCIDGEKLAVKKFM